MCSFDAHKYLLCRLDTYDDIRLSILLILFHLFKSILSSIEVKSFAFLYGLYDAISVVRVNFGYS